MPRVARLAQALCLCGASKAPGDWPRTKCVRLGLYHHARFCAKTLRPLSSSLFAPTYART